MFFTYPGGLIRAVVVGLRCPWSIGPWRLRVVQSHARTADWFIAAISQRDALSLSHTHWLTHSGVFTRLTAALWRNANLWRVMSIIGHNSRAKKQPPGNIFLRLVIVAYFPLDWPFIGYTILFTLDLTYYLRLMIAFFTFKGESGAISP